MSALLSTLVAAWARWPLSTAVGSLAVLVVAVAGLDWVFMAFSYFMLLGCAGWEGRVLWMLWHLLPVLKPAGALPWGGYGGTFADPDGYIWSLGYSAQGADQPYAE
ncbi:hypothetical protein AB0L44_30910 [Nonomuraea wenchangensis]|uniref:hypothetical protein n=1 Tax=Nonomuraea wenchangensis TaxID=568860 RepID=UPI00342C5EDE